MMNFNERLNKLLQNHPDVFKTEAQFWAYLRGALRRALWERSPMKIKAKKKMMSPPPDWYIGRAKSGTECRLTGEWTPTSKLEMDHMSGNVSLRSEEDIIPFIVHLLADEDELQPVCKEAHKIKSYSERMGITYEEAVKRKSLIAFNKLKREDKEKILVTHGVDVSKMKTIKELNEAYAALDL